jgi:hypothetical protein
MAEQPIRIQLSRAKGWRMPENTVKVDRSSQWGNEFRVEDFASAAECVAMFEHDIRKFACFHPAEYEAWIAPLRGKNIGCWCRLDKPCHGNILLELANPPEVLKP